MAPAVNHKQSGHANGILEKITASNANKEEQVATPEEQAKIEWARQMRVKFTPADMLDSKGNLNSEYFKPKQTVVKARKWTDKERKLLMKGIEKHGIGNWTLIKEESLEEWDVQELRLKTAILMGRQSLKQYHYWKGNEEAIAKEYERNRKIGHELGCWKGSVLVADDDGKVLQRIQETEPETAKGNAPVAEKRKASKISS